MLPPHQPSPPTGNGQMQGGTPNNPSLPMHNRPSPNQGEAHAPMSASTSHQEQPNGNAQPPAAARPPPPHMSGNVAGAGRGSFGGNIGAPHQGAGPANQGQPYPPTSFARGPPPPPGHIMQTVTGGPPPPALGRAQSSVSPHGGSSYPGPPPRGPPAQPSAQTPPRNLPPQEDMRMSQMAPTASRPPQPQQQPPPPPRPSFRPGPGPPQGPSPAKPSPAGGMRELRVEDALIYLDDVKREFGDRPAIYNEFLEIMKNFKSQVVDTPGVIDRVSNLFRGYNKLILGFNKFLPDGYKISLQDLERNDAEEAARQRAAAAADSQHIGGAQASYFQGGPQASQPGVRPVQPVPQQTLSGHLQGPEGVAMQVHASSPPPGGQQMPTQSFPNRPNGGAQALRAGPLPPSAVQGTSPQMQRTIAPVQGTSPQMQRTIAPVAGTTQQAVGQPMPPRKPQPVQQQHQAVEFDHAISYVTNIKKRFANDPGTYHAFLEILHTYQKEQRGIKEVLEQVAALFADHPDLLKEFTFFLPDAVQEQAKERLHRAAADSEARQAAAAQRGDHGMYAEAGGRHIMSPGYGGMRVETGRLALQQQAQASAGQKFIDMTGQVATRDVRAPQTSRKRVLDGGARMVPAQPPQPETFVYNSSVERQFFDATKEALTAYTRDGGQAWAEFIKCLDMYAQEILSRSEMLNFVEPLLGKRNSELFEEFKRILAAAGSPSGPTPSTDDSWHSVPLSEIDFSRCRRCSPSYRALPRDYPDPPCSDRNAEEKKVLNDIWVSLPVGSEESYTFRHMRRNQYEEVLFRCEDERFEIDMVIDSNAATLRRLEPIAEEIMQLAQQEMVTDLPAAAGGSTKTAAETEGGMGGMRYQYTFDRNFLGVVHRNCIARIYGDAGQEMLDLIMKNPTVAVPVVVQRLRQKDREWRAVRERLNRHWKELAETNYYKSLDNRSLTWRTIDKRATSTRTLISEIKDRAANNGNESQSAINARLEKAKEEHGGFYEVTMKERITSKLDLTNLPKPQKTLFTPHLSLMYENTSWAMRDAYRILSFALERGSNSPNDKERGNRLWREFLGPWFGLSLNWMQRPALSFKASSAEAPAAVINGEDSGRDDDDESNSADDNDLGSNVVREELTTRSVQAEDSDSSRLIGYHPIPAGAVVSTVFGEGRVLEFRRLDTTYVVALQFGKAYLRPNAVLCTVLNVEKSAYTNQLREKDTSILERADDMMAIGPQSLYLFFRLHQILVRRLNIAKHLAYNVPTDQTLSTLVEQMTEDSGHKRYEAYLSLVYTLIDGGLHHPGPGSGAAESGKYEDRVRCLLGHGAYELATMDKLISHLLKNLQSMGTDETMQNLVQLFRRHLDAGSFKPDAFRQEAAYLSHGENMFAFQICKVPDSDKRVLHTEFLGVIAESDDESMEVESEPASELVPKRQRRIKE